MKTNQTLASLTKCGHTLIFFCGPPGPKLIDFSDIKKRARILVCTKGPKNSPFLSSHVPAEFLTTFSLFSTLHTHFLFSMHGTRTRGDGNEIGVSEVVSSPESGDGGSSAVTLPYIDTQVLGSVWQIHVPGTKCYI